MAKGPRGPKPLPTKLKILSGSRYNKEAAAKEPQAVIGLPDPPDTLCPIAREEWLERGPGLVRMGVLGKDDIGVFHAYCQSYADFKRARDALNKLMGGANGTEAGAFLSPSKVGGPKRSPLLLVANDAMQNMVRFAAELGLTASARSRIETILQDDTESDLKQYLYAEKKQKSTK